MSSEPQYSTTTTGTTGRAKQRQRGLHQQYQFETTKPTSPPIRSTSPISQLLEPKPIKKVISFFKSPQRQSTNDIIEYTKKSDQDLKVDYLKGLGIESWKLQFFDDNIKSNQLFGTTLPYRLLDDILFGIIFSYFEFEKDVPLLIKVNKKWRHFTWKHVIHFLINDKLISHQVIDELMHNTSGNITHVSFDNCKRIHSKHQFEQYTLLQASHLQWIEFINCPFVNKYTLEWIGLQCVNLQVLKMEYCHNIAKHGLDSFKGLAPIFSKLKQFHVRSCMNYEQLQWQINPTHLFSSSENCQLQVLNLYNNNHLLQQHFLYEMSLMTTLNQLTHLNISNNILITERDLDALVEIASHKKLKFLYVEECYHILNDQFLEKIVKRVGHCLKHLYIGTTKSSTTKQRVQYSIAGIHFICQYCTKLEKFSMRGIHTLSDTSTLEDVLGYIIHHMESQEITSLDFTYHLIEDESYREYLLHELKNKFNKLK